MADGTVRFKDGRKRHTAGRKNFMRGYLGLQVFYVPPIISLSLVRSGVVENDLFRRKSVAMGIERTLIVHWEAGEDGETGPKQSRLLYPTCEMLTRHLMVKERRCPHEHTNEQHQKVNLWSMVKNRDKIGDSRHGRDQCTQLKQ
jgi:hypothetical protein